MAMLKVSFWWGATRITLGLPTEGAGQWQKAASNQWALELDCWVQVLALTLMGPWATSSFSASLG